MWQRNPDERKRRLERQAITGDLHAAVQLLQARLRSGELEKADVGRAAALGHPAALQIANPLTYNVHYNYGYNSIGQEGETAIVDGVLGSFTQPSQIIRIGCDFTDHAYELYDRHQRGLVDMELVRALNSLVANARIWADHQDVWNGQTEELFSHWTTQSREEFYQEYQVERIMSQQRIEASEIEDRIDQACSQLVQLTYLSHAENDLRWGTVYLQRIVFDRYRPALDLVALADHFRLVGEHCYAASDGQEGELRWQHQYLLDYCLRANRFLDR